MVSISSYVFRHLTAIPGSLIKTEEQKFKTPFQVLIALTVNVILKRWSSRIHKVEKRFYRTVTLKLQGC